MVNEEKTRIMIKVAQYEAELGAQAISEGNCYKTDYIYSNTLSVIVNFSTAYILLIVLFVLYNIDYIFLNFVTINYAKLFFEIFMPYILFIIFCTIMSYIHFNNKYKQNREKIKKYYAELKHLEKYYTESGKERADDTFTGA